jgi:hypothetical protein
VGSALVSVHKRIFLAEVFVRVGVGVFVRVAVRVTMVVSMPGGVRMAVVRVRMAVVRVGERVLMAVLVTVTVS